MEKFWEKYLHNSCILSLLVPNGHKKTAIQSDNRLYSLIVIVFFYGAAVRAIIPVLILVHLILFTGGQEMADAKGADD